MGRRKDPAGLQELKGNPSRRPIEDTPPAGDGEPAAELLPPDPQAADVPLSLQGDDAADARKIWEELAPNIAATNLMRSTDRQAFARYCRYLVDWRHADEQLRLGRADGQDVVYETNSAHGRMLRVNPWFLVRDRLEKTLTGLEDRFGLTPAARQTVISRQAAIAGLPLFGNAAAADKDSDAQAEDRTRPHQAVGFLSAPTSDTVN